MFDELTDTQMLAVASLSDAAQQMVAALKGRSTIEELKALRLYLERSYENVNEAMEINPTVARAQRLVSKVVKFYAKRGYQVRSVEIETNGGANVIFQDKSPNGEPCVELSEYAVKSIIGEPYDIEDT